MFRLFMDARSQPISCVAIRTSLVAFGIALGGCGGTQADMTPGETDATTDTGSATSDDRITNGVDDTHDATHDVSTSNVDASGDDTGGVPEYPEPGDWPPNQGPGGPAVEFAPGDLDVACAYLMGGGSDIGHHNLVQMYDGYLFMPWAPEWAGGGVSFFDISDPCDPIEVGVGASTRLRESHAIGFASVGARRFAVLAHKDPGLLAGAGGIEFWDITDPATPFVASELKLPGHLYPDAYDRVVLSAFWQVPWVYVAGSENGIYVVDASDPMNPALVHQHAIQPTMRAGQVQVVGNLLVVSAAEGPRTVLLDVSVPDLLQPIAGGDFSIIDAQGIIREAYFSNICGSLVWYAIKNNDGGLLAYDIADPSAPVLAGNFDSGGNGGYVFVKDGVAFVGESNFAGVYDVSDPSAIAPLKQLHLVGDLDTITPIGNVAVLSVDDAAEPGQASAVVPWVTAVDVVPPRVLWSYPGAGATELALTSRIGATFSEFIDPRSAWEGSVRLYSHDRDGVVVPVAGIASVQETIVNFAPLEPLAPATEYTFEIPAGGVSDYNGNAIEEPFVITFTTRDA